jgi:hypothetical protein
MNWLAFGPAPDPTPAMQAASAPGLLDILTDAADSATRPILHWFGSHPKVMAVMLAAIVIDNAIRMAWPDYSKRPIWARLVTGAIAPLVGNFWLAVVYFAKKFHLNVWTPKQDYNITLADTEQVQPQTKEGVPTGKPIESLGAPEAPKP